MGANIQHQNCAVIWLGTALLISPLLSLTTTAVMVRLGTTIRDAWAMTAQRKIVLLLEPTGDDSWTPMLQAYRQKIDAPPGDLYKVFFSNHVKFQYPPSSLMVFNLFPPSMTELVDGEISERLRQWLSWLSRAAVMMPKTNLKPLEESFRAQVFRMLKKKRKLTDEIISNLMGWRHSGFSVHMPSGLQETIMRHGKGLPSI